MVMRPLVAPRANGIGGIPPGAARQDIVVNGELIKEELDRLVAMVNSVLFLFVSPVVYS